MFVEIYYILPFDVTINDDSISDEPVTDENGDTVYNTTSSFDSEEFTSGYGDSNETIGDDGTVSTTKKREPLISPGSFVLSSKNTLIPIAFVSSIILLI